MVMSGVAVVVVVVVAVVISYGGGSGYSNIEWSGGDGCNKGGRGGGLSLLSSMYFPSCRPTMFPPLPDVMSNEE